MSLLVPPVVLLICHLPVAQPGVTHIFPDEWTDIWNPRVNLIKTTVLSLALWHSTLNCYLQHQHPTMNASLSPGNPTSYPAPCQCSWEKKLKMDQALGPLSPHRRVQSSSWFLISASFSPGCCGHLGSKPAEERFSLSVTLIFKYMYKSLKRNNLSIKKPKFFSKFKIVNYIIHIKYIQYIDLVYYISNIISNILNKIFMSQSSEILENRIFKNAKTQ